MKRVKSELLKKEFKKINQNLVIGLISIVLTIICGVAIVYEDGKEPRNTTNLHNIIEESNTDNINGNVEIATIYQKIKSTNSEYGLYVITDGTYLYLANLKNELANELIKNENLEKEPYTVYGKTKITDSYSKKIIIEWYNQIVNKEDRITSSKFETYFGGIYLDTNEAVESPILIVLAITAMLASIFSITFILVFIIRKIQTESTLKKLSDEDLEKIEKELADSDTFHYEKAHLILTKNYIISLTGKMLITNYKDLVWIYEYRLRQYGITTNKSLMAMLKNGKVKALLQVDGVTKKSTAIIKEVVETIVSKNPKLLVGYTSENKKLAKEIIKENKTV